MNIPSNLKYSKDHEWVLVEGNIATVGITDFAQDQLGDIVFVDIQTEGEDVAKCVYAAASGLLDFGTGTVLNADGGFHLRRL